MITVYPAHCDDFSTLGLGAVLPNSCTVTETAGGAFDLKMQHPIDARKRWTLLQVGNIIKAPAPIRETPFIHMVQSRDASTTWNKRRIKSKTAKLYNKKGGKRIRTVKKGAEFLLLSSGGGWAHLVNFDGGEAGWAKNSALENAGTYVMEKRTYDVPPKDFEPRQTRDQLFRIIQTDVDDAAGIVTVTAQHIFYDLAGYVFNRTDYGDKKKPANDLFDDLNLADADGNLVNVVPHDIPFTLVRDDLTGECEGDYNHRAVASMLCEKDVGIVPAAGARLIRDNYDVFIFPDEPRDRGVEIRHGKNLTGAILTTDSSNVVTRIIPVGKNVNGDDLYIEQSGDRESASGTVYHWDGNQVFSPTESQNPNIRIKRVEYQCKTVSKDPDPDAGAYPNDTATRYAILDKAIEDFEAGINAPTVGLEVDFVALENTTRYADYAALQTVHLYDTVRVISSRSNIDARVRVTGYEYDCLLHRYSTVTLGELLDLDNPVYGFDIAKNSVTGAKLVGNSVGGEKLRNASIEYAKISTAAVENLSAESITAAAAVIGRASVAELTASFVDAVRAHIGEASIDKATVNDLSAAFANIVNANIAQLNAGKITADEIGAALANVMELHAGYISAGTVEADRLSTAIAKAVSLAATTADITLADIQNLLVKALVVEVVTADTVRIKNLIVSDANILNAAIDNLTIRSNDGKYYAVVIGTDGEIRAQEVTEPSDRVQRVNYTAAELEALNGQIAADNGVFNAITAEAIAAGTLTAMQATIAAATIPELQTTALKAIGDRLDLSANASITSTVGKAVNASESRLNGAIESATANTYSVIEQRENAFKAEINADGIKAYLDFDEDGLRVGKDGQTYKTLTNSNGFHIEQTTDAATSVIGSFSKRSIYVENVRVGTVSNNGESVESSGVVIMRAAPDGGVMFVVEGD